MPEFSKILQPVLGFLTHCDNFSQLVLFPGISNRIYIVVTISFYSEIYFTPVHRVPRSTTMPG